MHPELRLVFAFFDRKFPHTPVAIHGSALRHYASARDVDMLMLADADYPHLMGQLGLTYSGWNVTRDASGFCTPVPRGTPPSRQWEHLRRTVKPLWIEGVSKPIQVSQSDKGIRFSDHKHALLLSNGTTLHPGVFHDKLRR